MTAPTFVLHLTSHACPEQYDAYHDGDRVGFLYLRHGRFWVDYPVSGGQEIHVAHPQGDGCFEYSERNAHLTAALMAIAAKIGIHVDPEDTLYEVLEEPDPESRFMGSAP